MRFIDIKGNVSKFMLVISGSLRAGKDVKTVGRCTWQKAGNFNVYSSDYELLLPTANLKNPLRFSRGLLPLLFKYREGF